MKEFYILSLKWSKNKDEWVLWGPNDSGYASDLNYAGVYTEEQIKNNPGYYNDGKSTKAIPKELVDSLYIRRSIPTTIGNFKLMIGTE